MAWKKTTVALKSYLFTIEVAGTGADAAEAWAEACTSLINDDFVTLCKTELLDENGFIVGADGVALAVLAVLARARRRRAERAERTRADSAHLNAGTLTGAQT